MDFLSLIITAFNTAVINVNTGIKKYNECNNNIIISCKIIPKYTPAITIVDECNNDDIGVGAFMAFNNHELKGNWDDLVNNINNKAITI